MLIRCPKCKVSYDVGEAVIPEEGKKVRCSQCGETWMCTADDLFEASVKEVAAEEDSDSQNFVADDSVAETEEEAADTENTTDTAAESENAEEQKELTADASLKPDTSKEMQEIFARLESQTESLFELEKNMSAHKKIYMALVRNLGLQRKKNRRLYSLIIMVLLLLSLFYLRYDIARVAPFMEKVYESCGIECVVAGEGLEFQNITRTEFEEDYVSKMEIRGFIANTTRKTLEIPTIQVEMLDKNGQALQYLHQEAPVKRITAGSRVAFRIVINKPSTFTKFVYLTFTKETPPDMIKAVNVDPREE